MDVESSLRKQIAAEAAEWLVQMQDAADEVDRKKFVQWLLRSPEHVEEFLACSQVWGDLDLRGDDFATERLIEEARAQRDPQNVVELPRPSSSSRREPTSSEPQPAMHARWVAAAALLAGIALTMIWVGLRGDHVETAIGEQRTLTLADGSLVYINTDSELVIELAEHERRIKLLRGEARFDVAKDPSRPFIVTTPQASVRAVGTSFNVQSVFKRTAVAVLEGRVEVTSKQQSASGMTDGGAPRSRARDAYRLQLAAGERAAVNYAGEIVPRAGPPLARVLAWTQRRLEFRDEPLATVIAEFNRYSTHPVYIADPELARHRISGSFGIRDVASLLQFLEQYQDVQIAPGTDGARLLMRRTPARPPSDLQGI